MPALNVLGTDPQFQLADLSAAIQRVEYKPSRLSELGIFSERSISSLDVMVEEHEGVLKLLDVMERGAPPESLEVAKRTLRSFRVPHIKSTARVLADQIIGLRAFGSATEQETVARFIEQRLIPLRSSVEYTIESHRLAAIKGTYANAGGAFPSLFTEFGVSQQTQSFALGTATTKVREKCLGVLTKIEDALGGSDFGAVRVLCGSAFWASLIEHDKVKETYIATENATSMRGDPRVELFYGGLIFERYRGTSLVKIPDGEAFAVPMDVPGLFITAFAPGDYMETAGSMGERIYAKQWPLEANRGVQLEVQSNPLNICTRPASVIKLTAA